MPASVVLIPSTELRDGVTYYRVQVADAPGARGGSGGVLRRYRDFGRLHAELVREFPGHTHILNSGPPLPGKALFKNSTSVVAQRQRQLAAYLTALAETPPFAASPTLREFLGLTEAQALRLLAQGTGRDSGRARERGTTAASDAAISAAMDEESDWTDRMQAVQRLLVDLKRSCNDRDARAAAGDTLLATSAESSANSLAEKVLEALQTLEKQIKSSGNSFNMKEQSRRKNLVVGCQSEVQALKQRLSTPVPSLFSSSPARGNATADNSNGPSPRRVLGRPLPSSSHPPPSGFEGSRGRNAPQVESGATSTAALDNQGLLQMQRQLMSAQDNVAGELASAARRLKELGTVMNEELETQNQLLDETRDHVDRASGRIRTAQRKTRHITGRR